MITLKGPVILTSVKSLRVYLGVIDPVVPSSSQDLIDPIPENSKENSKEDSHFSIEAPNLEDLFLAR